MAKTKWEVEARMKDLLASNDGDIVMSLMSLDLDPNWQGSDDWSKVCQWVVAEDTRLGWSDAKTESYKRLFDSDPEKLVAAIKSDMRDNYLLSGLAAMRLGVDRDLPVIAWAAENRHGFAGFKGELSLIRTLLWHGFSADEPEETSRTTALHMMVSVNWRPYAYPRAIGYLLEKGAEANARNDNGDTPLITLCGAFEWSKQHTEAFHLLMKAGADSAAKANDGASALSLLRENQAKAPHEDRAELIRLFER